MFEYLGSLINSSRPTARPGPMTPTYGRGTPMFNMHLVSIKTGKRMPCRTVQEAMPADTRQGRRARERFSKKWRVLHG